MGGSTDRFFSTTDSKVSAIEQHCVYMMATGKWPAGHKLPSIRAAESMWHVNRLTVQRAMQNLADRGLVERKERSGYYVAARGPARELGRHRYVLEHLYDSFSAAINEKTGLSSLAVFRYLSGLAEIKTRERPECAFVECTEIQAEGHAREIEARFSFPVLPVATTDLLDGVISFSDEVRVVFTTLFHVQAVSEALQNQNVTVQTVPIEVSPNLLTEIADYKCPTVMLETEQAMGDHIAIDAKNVLKSDSIDLQIVENVLQYMEKEGLKDKADRGEVLVLLSPRHWGVIPPNWRESEYIKPVQFRIVDTAWSEISSAIGLPLGDQNSSRN